MKLALVSDIHSNLEALEAVNESLSKIRVDRLIFIGDIVGYGADPNACIEALRQISDVMLAGNHDWAAVGKSSASNFNSAALQAIRWTRRVLTAANKKFLKGLPLIAVQDSILFVHSTPHRPEDWNYIFKIADADRSFAHFTQHICFIGHSHTPKIFIQTEDGLAIEESKPDIILQPDCRYIINNGSIGQPRDGTPTACYGIYDTDTHEYNRIRVPYDIDRARQKIIEADLPKFLAERLAAGR